ncbi:uncharacterized protein LOC123546637 isoform X2 [Mercenaria mercenaria]|uniref:uncharacterized protein LOC123546637 isoform X2 n=1 Tax=Mercenaria mercenaria TaxID=6596 RepID=UPI001E1E22BC|nr:uncharacterized protein LOC123546637 isoform X2 [Mercenaria mercenaria]
MSKKSKISREASVLDGHSPVNRYELLCVDHMARGKTGPDEEKMLVAFQAFDALIPNLGVYTRIFKKLRDDLYDAVYSDDLTTTQDGCVTKIPYFIHITRRQNQQSEKMDEMEDQLETVKKRLFEKHKQLEENQRATDDLKQKVNDLNVTIEDMKSDLADKMAGIEKLEKDLSKEKSDRSNERDIMQGDIDDLHAEISDKKEEIDFLSKYKKGYDDLYYAFLDQPEDEETPRQTKKPVVSTKRANIMTNIQLAKKLEDQIMTVLNTAVEEFDKFMEEHKEDLKQIEIKDDITDAEFEAQEIDIDNADQQLEAVQERFKNTIGDISNELLLLKQHSIMLMEQLQILEENHPTLMRKGDRLKVVDPAVSKSGDILLSKEAEKRVKRIQEESIKIQEEFVQSPYLRLNDDNWKELLDSILSAGLGDDEDEADSDPFIPQERVFSKYAAMMYTSNNQGRSFEEFKEAKYCPSCGEKTVICPHKLPGSERIFPLPINCTHLKIARPKVKINKELMRELMKQDEEEVTFDLPGSLGNKLDISREHSLRALSGSMMSPDSSRDGTSVTGSESHLRYSLLNMYDDYKQRTNLERNIPRPLSQDRCLSVMEQFWTYVIWEDDNGKEEDIHNSTIDKLYKYMEERYMVKDIMYLCNHDFISGVVEYSEQDKVIQLFGHVLVGNLEGACFRYMMLLCDFICAVDWKEVEDFRAFAAVVYPFLGEDDLETLQMSYTSYSENKISKTMVTQFIIHLVLKYREPRFQDMEHRLMPFQSPDSKQPSMSEKEFKEAIDNILPLTNDKLRRRLFFESEKMMRKEGLTNSVPVMRLAQIASYLGLLQITNIVRETINVRIQEWRARPSSSGSARVLQDHESQILHDEDHQLITMSKVKQLSTNISRRIKLRQERYDMGDEQSDW